MNWIFWLSIILVVIFWNIFSKLNFAYNERTDLYNRIENIGNTAINTVQGRITKAITEAVESTQRAHITTFTNEIEALKGSTTQAVNTEITGMKAGFAKDTKVFFTTNLDHHIQASRESIKDLHEQKVELQESFKKLHTSYIKLTESKNELFDKLIDPYGKLLLAAHSKHLKFYSLPDSDPDFESYLCQSTNTFHKVPKDFSRWKASDTTMNLNFLSVIYVNSDNGDSIPVPAELLHIIKSAEGQPLTRAIDGNGDGNKNADHPDIPKIELEPFGHTETLQSPILNLKVCPICGKQFTQESHTKNHLLNKKDSEHEKFRVCYPDFAKQFNSIS